MLATGLAQQTRWDALDPAIVPTPELLQTIADEELASTLAVPIRQGTDAVGVFYVHSRSRRQFTTAETALLQRLGDQVAVAITNARAHAQERTARTEVEALLAATASLGAQAEPEAVLRMLVRQAAALVGADRAVFVILRNGRLVIPGSWQSGAWIDDEHEVVPRGIVRLVWESRRPYRTNDALTDPNGNRAIAERYQIRAQMAAPLLGPGGEPFGVVSLNNGSRPEGFSERDERLLVAICETGAAILARARDVAARLEAERAAAWRKQEVEALLQAADQLSSAVEPEQVLRRVVCIAAELLAVRRVGIATNEADRVVLRHTWVDGVWRSQETLLSLDESIAGWVIRNAQSFRTSDLPESSYLFHSVSARDIPLTALSVPILGQDGRVLGALQLFERGDGRPFSDEDQRLAEGIAHHAAVALERATHTAALLQSERRFSALVQHISDAIAIIDATGVIRYESPSVERITGIPPHELVGNSGDTRIHPDDVDGARRYFREALHKPGVHEPAVFRFQHRNGSWLYVESVANNLLDDPSVRGVVMTSRDVTDRKQLEDYLLHQAVTDPLTGLPNRKLFLSHLTAALAASKRRQTGIAVLFLDLDGFKVVNDSLGHAAGDDLLRSVAQRLAACQRANDTVARFGGDEFAILLEDLSQQSDAIDVAQRILAELRRPLPVGKRRRLPTTVSIGVSFHGVEGDRCSAEELIREADIALYRAKAAGKAQAVAFAPSMSAQAIERMEIQADLGRALRRKELRVYYQPMVELASLRIVGAEALLRWAHPQRGLLDPGSFLPIAEETGLILPIGRWVLDQACRQARLYDTPGPDDMPFRVSVNLSALQLEQPNLVDQVAAALKRADLGPESLELEITESAVIPHAESSIATLAALKQLGVRLALDDFGTGYSSLRFLQQLALDTVKIDQSFIGRLGQAESTAAIVQAVVSLAHALGMAVTAEGIESEKQLEAVSALDCDFGQGFYFAQPGTARRLKPHFRRRSHLKPRAQLGRVASNDALTA